MGCSLGSTHTWKRLLPRDVSGLPRLCPEVKALLGNRTRIKLVTPEGSSQHVSGLPRLRPELAAFLGNVTGTNHVTQKGSSEGEAHQCGFRTALFITEERTAEGWVSTGNARCSSGQGGRKNSSHAPLPFVPSICRRTDRWCSHRHRDGSRGSVGDRHRAS